MAITSVRFACSLIISDTTAVGKSAYHILPLINHIVFVLVGAQSPYRPLFTSRTTCTNKVHLTRLFGIFKPD
jgi:hypothetical protein